MNLRVFNHITHFKFIEVCGWFLIVFYTVKAWWHCINLALYQVKIHVFIPYLSGHISIFLSFHFVFFFPCPFFLWKIYDPPRIMWWMITCGWGRWNLFAGNGFSQPQIAGVGIMGWSTQICSVSSQWWNTVWPEFSVGLCC